MRVLSLDETMISSVLKFGNQKNYYYICFRKIKYYGNSKRQ